MFKLALRSMGSKALLLTSLTVLTSTPGISQQQKLRELSGSVRDQHGNPLNKAVVQLENENTHELVTYIADADGAFHFKRVLSDTDYEVWAAVQGKESKKHSISKFDDKATLTVRLIVDL